MRPVCVVLAACLLLFPVGCRTGAERAGDHRSRVEVGMTQEQVEERLGEPDGWQENVGGYEVWKYAYRPNFGHFFVWRTVQAAELALIIAAVFGLLWLTRGAWANTTAAEHGTRPAISPAQETSDRFQRFTFTIGFDRETGRVAFISTPLPE